MTAETEGRVQLISRWKDVDGVDILRCNGADSHIVRSQGDFESAMFQLRGAETVWVHEIAYRNAGNRICFSIESSTAWTVEDGRLAAKKLWPRPDCQCECHPCKEAV